ncbi:MAG TPA: LptF/LptG family permease, partial [archaeon]|nr:LptF/LptG family permease [archaeon]
MKILYRYILSELAGPFVLSLSLLTFILFMRHMVFLFPKIVGKNLGWPVIAELLVLSLPFILALVLPMAVLVAVIMAFGRLSSDNEITALQSLGVPVHRLMVSPLAAALALMFFAIWFNDRVLPESNHKYKDLLMDIAYLKPTFTLREGVIMDDFPGRGLLVNRIKEQEGKRNLTLTAPDNSQLDLSQGLEGPAELFGIIITENLGSETRRTIVADSGYIRFTPDRKDAILNLYHGEIQEVDPRRQEKFQRMFFTRHQIRLPDVD